MTVRACVRSIVRRRVVAVLAGLLVWTYVGAHDAIAQGNAPKRASCEWLCPPEIDFMPGALRTHLFGGPLVRTLSTGQEHRLASTTSLELIISAAAQTAIPRLSLFGSVQWIPNLSETRNPFTLYTASEVGGSLRANAATVTMGGSVSLLPATATHGWFELAGNVGDLFSQAARPADRSSYTHKLDLNLIAHAHVFARAPAASYLHRASIYALLDYVATGLPNAGDEVPVGRRFVSRARPTALIVGLALPLTPPIK